MEICNWGSMNATGRHEYNIDLYHKFLRAGRRLFVHSVDDNHNKDPFDHQKNDSFGGFAMIMADKLEYDTIFNALEQGEMYSSMGPVFHEVSFDGKQVHVSCSDVAKIVCNCGSKTSPVVAADPGKTINQASFTLREGFPYVQVSIIDKDGKCADTRGFFRDELGLPTL